MIEVLKLALKALNAGEHAHLIMNTDGIKDKVRQAIAGLESQEPVALETVYETIIQWDEGGGKRSRRDLARRIIDLYTHPPQRTEQEPVECDGDFPEGFDKSLDIPAQALRQANAALCEVTNNRMWDVPALAERMLMFCRNTHPPQRTEQNFCSRCGKRTNDIHTCTPPQRTWAGLTDEEIRERWFAAEPTPDGRPASYNYARAIEAKLKEKNP